MNKDLSFNAPAVTKTVSNLLYRYHVVLFVVVVVGGMIVVMFMLNNTITQSTDTANVALPSAEQFDQATIDRLNSLSATPSTNQELSLPSGRINPFTE